MKRADVNWNIDADLCQQVIGGAPALWQKAGKMLSSGFAVFGVIEDAEILAHELLAEHSADTGRQLESLTARVAAAAPDAAPLFPLGLLGAMLPQALAYMRSMGADDAVCRSTFGDILRWVSRYETLHGEPGVDEFGWIVLPYAGRIFEIGSLQYQMAGIWLDGSKRPYSFIGGQGSARGSRWVYCGNKRQPPRYRVHHGLSRERRHVYRAPI